MSSASNGRWQMSRLRRETVSLLREWSKGLDFAGELGLIEDSPGEQGWTVDQLVSILLARDLKHRERSRRHSFRRAVKRQAEACRLPAQIWPATWAGQAHLDGLEGY